MSEYKIVVKIDLVECKGSVNNHPEKSNDGSFTMTISESDAISIDKCEQAALQTVYPTIREAVSRHLSDVSKKKQMKKR